MAPNKSRTDQSGPPRSRRPRSSGSSASANALGGVPHDRESSGNGVPKQNDPQTSDPTTSFRVLGVFRGHQSFSWRTYRTTRKNRRWGVIWAVTENRLLVTVKFVVSSDQETRSGDASRR